MVLFRYEEQLKAQKLPALRKGVTTQSRFFTHITAWCEVVIQLLNRTRINETLSRICSAELENPQKNTKFRPWCREKLEGGISSFETFQLLPPIRSYISCSCQYTTVCT